jgi:hypothetical protein
MIQMEPITKEEEVADLHDKTEGGCIMRSILAAVASGDVSTCQSGEGHRTRSASLTL